MSRKSAKATVVLFPLLGMTYLIFAVNPEDGGGAETAYHVVNAFLQSTQVSLVYMDLIKNKLLCSLRLCIVEELNMIRIKTFIFNY